MSLELVLGLVAGPTTARDGWMLQPAIVSALQAPPPTVGSASLVQADRQLATGNIMARRPASWPRALGGPNELEGAKAALRAFARRSPDKRRKAIGAPLCLMATSD